LEVALTQTQYAGNLKPNSVTGPAPFVSSLDCFPQLESRFDFLAVATVAAEIGCLVSLKQSRASGTG
jgi:hypothetical protein